MQYYATNSIVAKLVNTERVYFTFSTLLITIMSSEVNNSNASCRVNFMKQKPYLELNRLTAELIKREKMLHYLSLNRKRLLDIFTTQWQFDRLLATVIMKLLIEKFLYPL
jgi:hypothetical protein